jgi:anti-sigma factor RsiW
MGCEKYSGWIDDVALGGAPRDRETEVLAHISACSACRESYERARKLALGVGKAIESVLACEPSPQFQAKVRARLAAEDMARRPGRFAWAPVGAVAIMLLAVLSFAAVNAFDRRGNVPVATTTNVAGSNRALDDGKTVPQQAIRASRRGTGDTRRRGSAKVRAVSAQQPKDLVRPEQLTLIRTFAEGVRDGQIDGVQILKLQQQSELPLRVDPIQIAPLNIPQIGDPNTSLGDS